MYTHELYAYILWIYIFLHICIYLHIPPIYINGRYCATWDSQVSQHLRICLPMQETWIQSLGQEDPLEKKMEIHSSILAWEIPWTEEPGRLQSIGSQKSDTTWWLNNCAIYSPFATPILNPFYVLLAPKRWPLCTSLVSLTCWLVFSWVSNDWHRRKEAGGWKEREVLVLLLSLFWLAPCPWWWLHTSTPKAPTCNPHSRLQHSAPSAPRMYLNLGFLKTDWDGEVQAHSLMRSILGDITLRNQRKQDWPLEVNMKYSSVRPPMMLQGALELW